MISLPSSSVTLLQDGSSFRHDLVLSNVTDADSGRYTCAVTSPFTLTSNEITLDIFSEFEFGPPGFHLETLVDKGGVLSIFSFYRFSGNE